MSVNLNLNVSTIDFKINCMSSFFFKKKTVKKETNNLELVDDTTIQRLQNMRIMGWIRKKHYLGSKKR